MSESVLPSTDGERVRALDLELVAAQVREDAVAVALEVQDDLHGVIARRDRAAEDRDLLLIGERAGVVRAVVLDRTVDDEERAREAEGARHLVLEEDLGARARGAAAEDRVAEEREPRVAATDLVLQLVDARLEVAEANAVRRAVHRALLRDRNSGTARDGRRGACGRRRRSAGVTTRRSRCAAVLRCGRSSGVLRRCGSRGLRRRGLGSLPGSAQGHGRDAERDADTEEGRSHGRSKAHPLTSHCVLPFERSRAFAHLKSICPNWDWTRDALHSRSASEPSSKRRRV